MAKGIITPILYIGFMLYTAVTTGFQALKNIIYKFFTSSAEMVSIGIKIWESLTKAMCANIYEGIEGLKDWLITNVIPQFVSNKMGWKTRNARKRALLDSKKGLKDNKLLLERDFDSLKCFWKHMSRVEINYRKAGKKRRTITLDETESRTDARGKVIMYDHNSQNTNMAEKLSKLRSMLEIYNYNDLTVWDTQYSSTGKTIIDILSINTVRNKPNYESTGVFGGTFGSYNIANVLGTGVDVEDYIRNAKVDISSVSKLINWGAKSFTPPNDDRFNRLFNLGIYSDASYKEQLTREFNDKLISIDNAESEEEANYGNVTTKKDLIFTYLKRISLYLQSSPFLRDLTINIDDVKLTNEIELAQKKLEKIEKQQDHSIIENLWNDFSKDVNPKEQILIKSKVTIQSVKQLENQIKQLLYNNITDPNFDPKINNLVKRGVRRQLVKEKYSTLTKTEQTLVSYEVTNTEDTDSGRKYTASEAAADGNKYLIRTKLEIFDDIVGKLDSEKTSKELELENMKENKGWLPTLNISNFLYPVDLGKVNLIKEKKITKQLALATGETLREYKANNIWPYKAMVVSVIKGKETQYKFNSIQQDPYEAERQRSFNAFKFLLRTELLPKWGQNERQWIRDNLYDWYRDTEDIGERTLQEDKSLFGKVFDSIARKEINMEQLWKNEIDIEKTKFENFKNPFLKSCQKGIVKENEEEYCKALIPTDLIRPDGYVPIIKRDRYGLK